jgi:hypothetical protein
MKRRRRRRRNKVKGVYGGAGVIAMDGPKNDGPMSKVALTLDYFILLFWVFFFFFETAVMSPVRKTHWPTRCCWRGSFVIHAGGGFYSSSHQRCYSRSN